MFEPSPQVVDTLPQTSTYEEVSHEDSTPEASPWGFPFPSREGPPISDPDSTSFSFYRPFFDHRPSWADTVLSSTQTGRKLEPEKFHSAARSPKVEQARDKRLTLLARKYAAKGFSEEETARLEILTARLRQMVPRVEVRDFEELEKIAQEMQASRDRLAEIKRKLGFDR